MALLLPENERLNHGFVLSYALYLALFFAALFSILSYFSFSNLKLSSKSYAALQAKYLAESANLRALALMNTRTMPDSDVLDDEDEELIDGSDDDFDDYDEEEEDEDFDDDEDDDIFDESLLEVQPRYINYTTKDIYYVNIQDGSVINQDQYSELLAEQRSSRAGNALLGDEEEFNVEEVYLPLPEVNISYVGLIKIPPKTQLKPGFEIKLADKLRIDIKQDNILGEYLGIGLQGSNVKNRPRLSSINPNYASPGDLIDIFVEGENLSSSRTKFSSLDLEIIDISDDADFITVSVDDKAKAGTYNLTISGQRIHFHIAPEFKPGVLAPELYNIFIEDKDLGSKQMTEIPNNGRIQNLQFKGRNLAPEGIEPIIVSDIKGVSFDIKSFQENEVIVDLVAKSLPLNETFNIKILTAGGESNSWPVSIKAQASGDGDLKPFTGMYSTRLKLLQANSLSNLPWGFDDFEEEVGNNNNTNNSGRPANANKKNEEKKSKEYNLLNSDLETVWLLESIATVNGYSYKESMVVRRTAPKIAAPFISNTELRFGSKDFKIQGIEEARVELQDSVSEGDVFLEFINEFPVLEDLADEEKLVLTGDAVVEDLELSNEENPLMNPNINKFETGALVSVIAPGRFETASDYGFIKKINNESIIIEEPGFRDLHFIRDILVQFIPAVISNTSVDEDDAKSHLEPNYAWLELENLSGFQNLENLLFTNIPSLNYFKRNLSNQFPGGYIYELDEFNRLQVAEYFSPGEYFGLNILQGEITFNNSNPLYGQGILIIDTTEGGRNPQGGTVRITSTAKNQSEFKGLIYVIGNLIISGKFEMEGAVIVKSPQDGNTSQISADGVIHYNKQEISKTMFDLPFVVQPGTKSVKRLDKHEFKEK